MICHDYGQPDRTEIDGVTVYNMHRPGEGIPGLRFIHPNLTSLWRALTRVDADVYYQRTADVLTAFMAHFCKRHGRKSIYAGASDVDFLPGRKTSATRATRRSSSGACATCDRIVTQNDVQQKAAPRQLRIEGVVIPSCYMPPAGARGDRAGYVLWTAPCGPPSAPSWRSSSRGACRATASW
jgi:hypothetical protein